MADNSHQRHPQEHGGNYQPTYPPQAPPMPPMDRSNNVVPQGSQFGSGYESNRGGGVMRGSPMRGHAPYNRGGGMERGGGRGGGVYTSPGGYNREYPDVAKSQYHERDEWCPNNYGPAMPPQSYPPPQRGSTIIIHNLPTHVTEQDLVNHFGSAGLIKLDPRTRRPEIWLGPQMGEARITFQDPQVAVNAVQWYNNGDFQGKTIHVEMDEEQPHKPPPMHERMHRRGPFNEGFGGRPGPMGGPGGPIGGRAGPPPPRNDRFPPQRGYGGMRGGRDQGRDGDWICGDQNCQNSNFKWRSECNRCRAPRPDSDFPTNMNGNNEDRFESRPPYAPRGGRGFPQRSGLPGPMGRGGYGRGGGPMRGRGGGPVGRGGFNSRGAPNGNWRPRPY